MLFATASKEFTPIVGKPTDDDIFNITKVLYPLLHNLKYNEFIVAGAIEHNLVGLLQLTAIYTAARGAAFAHPVNPGPYNLTIPDDATPVVRNRMEAAHRVLVDDFNTFGSAEDGIKAFIIANVDETWIKPLRDPMSYYNNVTGYNLLEFLRTNSGGLLSWECRVADMSARHSDVGGLRQKRRVAATQDMKKETRHTQFMSITADKFKSVQTYELATLP